MIVSNYGIYVELMIHTIPTVREYYFLDGFCYTHDNNSPQINHVSFKIILKQSWQRNRHMAACVMQAIFNLSK